MRVISGSARGLTLRSPKGMDIRPTLDHVKEAVFSMLTPFLPCGKVLDLFAGSGAFGIEALSRGCGRGVFVDNSPDSTALIKDNLLRARLLERALVVQEDVFDYLTNAKEPFDIVFLDPPYRLDFYGEALRLLTQKNLLTVGAIAVAEWDNNVLSPVFPPSFEILRDKRYGRVSITVLRSTQ